MLISHQLPAWRVASSSSFFFVPLCGATILSRPCQNHPRSHVRFLSTHLCACKYFVLLHHILRASILIWVWVQSIHFIFMLLCVVCTVCVPEFSDKILNGNILNYYIRVSCMCYNNNNTLCVAPYSHTPTHKHTIFGAFSSDKCVVVRAMTTRRIYQIGSIRYNAYV